MSINNLNTYLNIKDSHLRVVSGNVYAQAMNIGGINVETAHGLQSVSDTGNVTSNTVQFSNAITSLTAASNVVVTGNVTAGSFLGDGSGLTGINLQAVTDAGNVTSNTVQFSNATTAFKATSNLELTANTAIVVESNVLMDFKTLGQIEFPGSTVEQEYPPRALTGYETLVEGHGVFCASASMPTLGALSLMTPSEYDAVNTNSYSIYFEPNSDRIGGSSGELGNFFYDNGAGVNTNTYLHWSSHPPYIALAMAQMGSFGSGIPPNCPATQLWIDKDINGTNTYKIVGIKSGVSGIPMFNKNDALTDYWESAASTYTSTSGGSPAVSTSGSERLASNAPYGSWVTLKLPYEICLKRYEFTGTGTKSPKEGQIWGSTDGTTWSHVHTFTGGVADVKNNETVSGNTNYYSEYAFITTKITGADTVVRIVEIRYFGTPGPTTLDKGSLTLGRSLDVPRVSRYDVDTETPRPEKLVVDFDTTVNSSPTDISGKGNHGAFVGTVAGAGAQYSPADKAFVFDGTNDSIQTAPGSNVISGTAPPFTASVWVNNNSTDSTYASVFSIEPDTYGTNTNVWFYIRNGQPTLQFENNYVEFYEPGTSTGGATRNIWHHLVVSYNGNSTIGGRRCWLNGVEQTSSAVSGSGNLTLGTTRLTLGVLYYNNNHVNDMTGKISNFKLYDTVLEPSEVQKLYRLGRTGRSMVISDTAVGIGKVPEAQLDVRGNISCDGVFRSKNPIAFEAYYTDGTLSTTGTYLPNYVRYNYGGCYEQSTGRFYAPINGIYAFHWHAYTNEGDSTSRIFIDVNGEDRGQKGNSLKDMGQQLSFSIYLNAGDYLLLKGKSSYTLYFHGYINHNMYSGHLVIAM